MRKLGHGQTIMFCAPQEVDRLIREIGNLDQSEQVKIIDLIRWTIHETLADIEHHIPHWAQQGADHFFRSKVENNISTSSKGLSEFRSAWLQREARTLEELYGPGQMESQFSNPSTIPAIRERLELFSVDTDGHQGLDEQQEREVEVMHEAEKERAIERAPAANPAPHSLDINILSLVETGRISPWTASFQPLMTTLRSQLDTLHPPNPWSSTLWATHDFQRVTMTAIKQRQYLNEFHRPVNWILSVRRKDSEGPDLIAISPFEANELLPAIRSSSHVQLHIYEPRVSQTMLPTDSLTFYSIPGPETLRMAWKPPLLSVRCQLNLWSGQLYLESYDMYVQLCLLLGLQPGQAQSSHQSLPIMSNDRFVRAEHRHGPMRDLCLFDESPVPLLKELFNMRRRGMNFLPTHMGRILHGRLLTEDDFEDS